MGYRLGRGARFGLLAVMLGRGLAEAASYNITPFDYPGATATYAVRINNAGEVLGWYPDASRAPRYFVRSADGATYRAIADPPNAIAGETRCTGLNNLGQIAGSFRDSAGIHQFIRSASGEFTIFDVGSVFPAPSVEDINDRGDVVGRIGFPPDDDGGFLRKADGSVIALKSSAPLGSIVPQSINNNGVIVGWVLTGSSQGTQHGFVRSADGVYTKFDVPGTWTYTRITALNDSRQMAGVVVGGPGWVTNRDASITYLPAYLVSAINAAGNVAGYFNEGTKTRAFVGTPGAPATEPTIRTTLAGVLTSLNFGGARTIAPGSWIEIYGENLAPVTRAWRDADFQGSMAPTTLEGVSVSIGGVAAYVSYVSPGQVNAIVPEGVKAGTAMVTVQNKDGTSAGYGVTVKDFQPVILSLPPTFAPNYGAAVAVYPDFTTYVLPPSYTNVPTRRAKPGDTIIFFGTGFGKVSPEVGPGQMAGQASTLAGKVQFTFRRSGGPAATGKVTYAGVVPGTVALYQFNVVAPEVELAPRETESDYVSCDVTVDGVPANGWVGLYISMVGRPGGLLSPQAEGHPQYDR